MEISFREGSSTQVFTLDGQENILSAILPVTLVGNVKGNFLMQFRQLQNVTLSSKSSDHLDYSGTRAVAVFGEKQRANSFDLKYPFSDIGKLVASLKEVCRLKHKNIFRYLAFGNVHQDHPEFSSRMLLEGWPGDGQTLHQFIRSKELNKQQILSCSSELLDALAYLHGQQPPIVIGSLRSSSVIMTPDRQSVKISDIVEEVVMRHPNVTLGPQAVFSWYQKMWTRESIGFVFPDILRAIIQLLDWSKPPLLISRADIWSFGCVVLDMLTQINITYVDKNGNPLDFKLMTLPDIARIMTNGGAPQIPATASPEITQLCHMCFQGTNSYSFTAEYLLTFVRNCQPIGSHFVSSNRTSCQLHFDDHLGVGTFGEVYAVSVTNNNIREVTVYKRQKIEFALKVLYSQQLDSAHGNILLGLQHINVVRYITTGHLSVGVNNVILKESRSGILMKYYQGGTLNDLAKKGLSEEQILVLMRQVAAGTAFLHGQKEPIVHGDLKGENIFLTADKKTIKIGDLENFAVLVNGKTNTTGLDMKMGTMFHMSPEMLNYTFTCVNVAPTGIGRATDIWSIGCTALELFGGGVVHYLRHDGTTIAQHIEPSYFTQLVSAGAYPDFSSADTRKISPRFRENIQMCLCRKPEERPKAWKLIQDL